MTSIPSRLFPVFVGISIPAIVIGRSALGAFIILALACIPLLPDRKEIWAKSVSAMKSRGGLFVLITFIAWIPNLFNSLDPLVSFTTLIRSFLYILAVLFIYSALSRDQLTPEYALRTLVISSTVLALIAVVGLIGPSELVGFIRAKGWADYNATLYLKESAISGALLIPMLIWIAYRYRGLWAILCAIAVIACLIMIWLTGNRSSMAGLLALLIVVGIFVSLYQRNTKKTVIAAFIIMIGAILIVGWLYFFYNPNVPKSAVELLLPGWLVDPQRQTIWAFSWNAGEPHRWFGVGINAIDKLASAAEWNDAISTRNIPLHPHNWMVEIIIETGIIGFISMLLGIGYFSLRWARQFLRTGDSSLLALLGVWSVYWATSLFSVSYWSSWLQASFLITTAICLACRQAQATTK